MGALCGAWHGCRCVRLALETEPGHERHDVLVGEVGRPDLGVEALEVASEPLVALLELRPPLAVLEGQGAHCLV